jgi:hypothetical protein
MNLISIRVDALMQHRFQGKGATALRRTRRPGCSGDAREAVKALIVANRYLETDLEKLKAAASMGYARGKLIEEAKTLPRDRKDWYD